MGLSAVKTKCWPKLGMNSDPIKTLSVGSKQISKCMLRLNHVFVAYLKAISMCCIHDIDKFRQNRLLFIKTMQFSCDKIRPTLQFLVQKSWKFIFIILGKYTANFWLFDHSAAEWKHQKYSKKYFSWCFLFLSFFVLFQLSLKPLNMAVIAFLLLINPFLIRWQLPL